MMDRSRDLGYCETSIKINKHSEENMQTQRGRGRKRWAYIQTPSHTQNPALP